MDKRIKNFLIISAFGITKEPVASNRISGIYQNISHYFPNVKLVAIDFWGQTQQFTNYPNVRRVKISAFQKLFRYLLDLRKKIVTGRLRNQNNRYTQKAEFPSTINHYIVTKKSRIKELIKLPANLARLWQHTWYVEGYSFPFLRFFHASLFSCLSLKGNVVLFASSGPAAVGLVGVLIKKILRKKVFLISDFRDPIAVNISAGELSRSFFLRRMETTIVKNSDLVTAVSNGVMQKLLMVPDKTSVIENGFSNDLLFKKAKIEVRSNIIVYTGSLYGKLLESLHLFFESISSFKDVRFVYAGKNSEFVKDIAERVGIFNRVIDSGKISKNKAKKLQKEAHILLLIKTPGEVGVMTGKFFEYVTSPRPILVIGDDDEEFNERAKEIGGVFIAPFNHERIKETVEYLLNTYKSKSVERNMKELNKYSWTNLMEKLVRQLDELL